MKKQKKLYYKALLAGIIGIILICIAFNYTYRDRNIRLHGTVIKAPIVEFYGRISRPNGSAIVSINGKKLDAGSSDYRVYKLGDSINVCYIPGEYCVVQTRMNPNRYYLFYTLEVIVLLICLYLIVGGLIGKDPR